MSSYEVEISMLWNERTNRKFAFKPSGKNSRYLLYHKMFQYRYLFLVHFIWHSPCWENDVKRSSVGGLRMAKWFWHSDRWNKKHCRQSNYRWNFGHKLLDMQFFQINQPMDLWQNLIGKDTHIPIYNKAILLMVAKYNRDTLKEV